MPTVPMQEEEDERSLVNQIAPNKFDWRRLQSSIPGVPSLSYIGNYWIRRATGDIFFPMERHLRSKATEEAIRKIDAVR